MFSEIVKDLFKQKGVEILEGHAMSDHVHVCLSKLHNYSISHVVGFLKGKTAMRLHRELYKTKRDGKSFWARGYFVNTVGIDKTTIRNYIKHQKHSDKNSLN